MLEVDGESIDIAISNIDKSRLVPRI